MKKADACQPDEDGVYKLAKPEADGSFPVKVYVRTRPAKPGDPTPHVTVGVNMGTKGITRSKVLGEGEQAIDAVLFDGINSVVVTAKATKEATEGKPVRLTFNCDGGQTVRLPPIWVLAIGVNKYDNLPELKWAEADAKGIADFYGRILPPERVRLVGDSPSRQAILDGIKWLASAVEGDTKNGPRATVIVFVSSHGDATTIDGRKTYFVAPREYDPKSPQATGVNWEEAVAAISAISCQNAIIFADNCFSGGVQQSVQETQQKSGERAVGANLAMSSALDKQILALASCQPDEVSYELPESAGEEYHHGAFTYGLLKALAGADMELDAGSMITYELIAAKTILETSKQVRKFYRGSSQTPYGPFQPSRKRLPVSLVPQAKP